MRYVPVSFLEVNQCSSFDGKPSDCDANENVSMAALGGLGGIRTHDQVEMSLGQPLFFFLCF